MSQTSINLITFVSALKDIRRDIRLSRLWGLTQDEARRLRKIPFRQILLICHLIPFPLFTLRKTATQAEADHQSKSIRELWVRYGLSLIHDRIDFESIFGDDHTLFADPVIDRQELRFHVHFLDPQWILGEMKMTEFVPKHYYVRLEEPLTLTQSLIRDEAFVHLLDSEMPAAIVGNLFEMSATEVTHLRNHLTLPKRITANKGPQIRMLKQHHTDRFFLFEGVRRFMGFRQRGLSVTQSYVWSLKDLASLPLFRANRCPDIDYSTNLYWALVTFGFIRDDKLDVSDAIRLGECITAIFQENLTDMRCIKVIPTFEPVLFASTKQEAILNAVNAAITDRDFTRTRFNQIIMEQNYAQSNYPLSI